MIYLTFANDTQHRGRFLEALRPEYDGIKRELADYEKKGGQVYAAGSSDPDSIISGLNNFKGRVQIFHYSGHANGVGLYIETLENREAFLTGDNLVQSLREEAEAHLKLVFLNACLTRGLVEKFQSIGVPAIIATYQSIPDVSAKKFAIAFYRSLAVGNSLQTAFSQAKTVIAPEDGASRVYRDLVSSRSTHGVPDWGLFVQDETILDYTLEVNPSQRTEIQRLRNLILENRHQEVLEILRENYMNRFPELVSNIVFRFKSLEDENDEGDLTNEENRVARNKLIKSLKSVLDKIEKRLNDG